MSDSQERIDEDRHEDRQKSKDSDFEGIERRKVKRIRGIIVEYRRHGSKDAPQGVFLRDMSPRGFSISVNEKFEVDEVLGLNVYLTGAKDPAVVEVKVCWVRISEYLKKSDKVHYDVGLRICNAEESDLKIIDDYMEQHKMDKG